MPVDIRSSSLRTTQTNSDSDSIEDSVPPPPPPPPPGPSATVREKRLAREKEEKQRRQAEKRKARQKKADAKYHGNVREALEELKDTLSEGPGECPTTISEVYIAAGEAVIRLRRQDYDRGPDEEDYLSIRAGKPPCKANHQLFTATRSDSEDSDDRPSKRRRRSERADGARMQRRAERNYRKHRSDALRWLSKVVSDPSSGDGVCEVIHAAIVEINLQVVSRDSSEKGKTTSRISTQNPKSKRSREVMKAGMRADFHIRALNIRQLFAQGNREDHESITILSIEEMFVDAVQSILTAFNYP
ncbi:hypothetical protein SISNIDRAFT_490681 [Sistotremastrum niveocremeum HHB9708]|uniref:Uncharacterized protein n=1 Tax=Sistotremastrum niveocremeum HHB9708 TaxID=1314777 RepID=A0A164NNI2_9AGAM|nr:hypothetical protein SISNIDRAFT_490681 [Sistotremastrum niveocremeum HHB9708]